MPTPPSNSIHPKSRAEWRKWLEQNHARTEGIWLVSYKKATGKPRFDYGESVEEALCFGWIDGLIKSIDDEKYKKYFAPRRKGSKWSAKNKEIIARLIKDNQVEKNGLLVIERSKKVGSWDSNDDNTITEEKIQMFESKIANNKEAAANYRKMPKSIRRQFAGLYFEPKKEDTRNKRLLELIDLLERNVKPMEKYSKK